MVRRAGKQLDPLSEGTLRLSRFVPFLLRQPVVVVVVVVDVFAMSWYCCRSIMEACFIVCSDGARCTLLGGGAWAVSDYWLCKVSANSTVAAVVEL